MQTVSVNKTTFQHFDRGELHLPETLRDISPRGRDPRSVDGWPHWGLKLLQIWAGKTKRTEGYNKKR
ncbi:unnamed protein product [Pleuronectes platessa]|uniref:Uncharacterized protein n=1 Tax=Pleuronectes platessa TaxID=8262 RepID=A0A9N7UQQ2_PLEPL|nr:unnamed protein product [Pleuronectes platessa]